MIRLEAPWIRAHGNETQPSSRGEKRQATTPIRPSAYESYAESYKAIVVPGAPTKAGLRSGRSQKRHESISPKFRCTSAPNVSTLNIFQLESKTRGPWSHNQTFGLFPFRSKLVEACGQSRSNFLPSFGVPARLRMPRTVTQAKIASYFRRRSNLKPK